MNRYVRLGIVTVLMVLAVGALWLYSPDTRDEESVHYHAGFRVYIDDQLQDYSDYKYMNFVPCSEHDEKKSKEEEQIEKAHLHDGVPDVVHVHIDGAKWGDLFTNIQVELPKDKMLKAYIEGAPSEDVMNAPIKAYTTAIFVIGESVASREGERVSTDHIKEVEARSELCASN